METPISKRTNALECFCSEISIINLDKNSEKKTSNEVEETRFVNMLKRLIFKIVFKILHMLAEEVAQSLRTLVSLPVDVGSIPNTKLVSTMWYYL